jgi:hypothetical protein
MKKYGMFTDWGNELVQTCVVDLAVRDHRIWPEQMLKEMRVNMAFVAGKGNEEIYDTAVREEIMREVEAKTGYQFIMADFFAINGSK